MLLVAVMLLGLIAIPAEAVTTSTAARFYRDFTAAPAYQKYTRFAQLYVPDYSIPVPGLEHTDVNGQDCTTMVPQGICFANDYMILSAYDANGKCNSVLYVISNFDSQNRTYLATLVLPTKAQVGGIAFDGSHVWIANGKYASAIGYDTLVSSVERAVASKKDSISVTFQATCATGMMVSFLTYSDGLLWCGEYAQKGDTDAKMYGYTIDPEGKVLTRKYAVSLPDRVQSAGFYEGNLILSRSNGTDTTGVENISQLMICTLTAPDQQGNLKRNATTQTLELPPMVKGVAVGSTYLYTVYQSAATGYLDVQYPVDRIVAFRLADCLQRDDSLGNPLPGETYFPACNEAITSFADALVSKGYDSGKETRTKIAQANGLTDYSGSTRENETLLALMKEGKLINPGIQRLTDAQMQLRLDQTALTVRLGQTGQISAMFGQGSVSWKSSNPAAAVVSALNADTVSVKPRGIGKTVITCTLSNGRVAKCAVNVVAEYFQSCEADSWIEALGALGYDTSMETRSQIAGVNGILGYSGTADQNDQLLTLLKAGKLINPGVPQGITQGSKVVLDQTTGQISVGQSMQLVATFSQGTVLWKTSNANVATVTVLDSDTVLISGLAEGKATITCILSDESVAKCIVKVSAADAPDDEAVTGIYFGKCDAACESFLLALESMAVDSSLEYRTKIAQQNGIENYTGTAQQDQALLSLFKSGKLIRPRASSSEELFVISFQAGGGSGTMADVLMGRGEALPANEFTMKGYTFQGWATGSGGSVVYPDQGVMDVSSNITLYAVWKANAYRITYDANGGSGTMADTVVTYGVSTKLRTPTFTRSGYTLTGWYRYRVSDNKWIYTAPDGETNSWFVEGTQPSGYQKSVIGTTSSVSKTSPHQDDVIILYAVWTKGEQYTSLDGKKVMFIGNSFLYYGGAVNNGSPKKTDNGWFKDICRANGEDVTVYDCTYGAHHLYDFTAGGCKSGSCHDGKDLLSGLDLKSIDYVFISESGNNNANFVRDVKNIMKRFPSKTKFIYLSHSYTYIKNHTNITKKLSEVQKLGVGVVEWGKLVDDIIDGRTSVPGATVKYKKTTFIKNKGDTHHPNPLAGYITAQMAYCAVTGKSAVGQMPDVYNVGDNNKYGKGALGYSAYISKHYSSTSATNFKTVLKSKKDMEGLQKLMNKYLAKRDLGIDG